MRNSVICGSNTILTVSLCSVTVLDADDLWVTLSSSLLHDLPVNRI